MLESEPISSGIANAAEDYATGSAEVLKLSLSIFLSRSLSLLSSRALYVSRAHTQKMLTFKVRLLKGRGHIITGKMRRKDTSTVSGMEASCGLGRSSPAAYAVWSASHARTSIRWLKNPRRLGGVETQADVLSKWLSPLRLLESVLYRRCHAPPLDLSLCHGSSRNACKKSHMVQISKNS